MKCEESLNDIDPIAYAILYQTPAKKDNENYEVTKPTVGTLTIAKKNGTEEIENAAIFDNLFAIHPYSVKHSTLTHVPTGYAMATLSTPWIKAHLNLLAVLTPLAAQNSDARASEPKVAAKAIKPLAMAMCHLDKCWRNSEIEELAGCFWRDRQAAENELVDLGLPRKLAEKFAFANKISTR